MHALEHLCWVPNATGNEKIVPQLDLNPGPSAYRADSLSCHNVNCLAPYHHYTCSVPVYKGVQVISFIPFLPDFSP